jgi:hypothetical protein
MIGTHGRALTMLGVVGLSSCWPEPDGGCASQCGDRCVDVSIDPDNCGGCGNACAFANAYAGCSSGTCYLAACKPGFVNLDGSWANGCECVETNGGVEICDGVDNNCDGIVDQQLTAGGYVSVCDCSDTALSLTSAQMDQDEAHTSCTTVLCDMGGAPESTPTMTFCCDATGAWSQCRYSVVDLNSFDADSDGTGVLQVVVDLSAAVPGLGLDLWYGNYPRRKKLPILTGQETPSVGSGRIVKYFVPEDAVCPAYQQSDLDSGAFANFPSDCVPATVSWSCSGGKWATLGPDCAFDYSSSIVYLTAESCSETVSATASIVGLYYYASSSTCWCLKGSACGGNHVCDTSAGVPAPFCSASNARCAGICADPASVAP